MKNYWHEKFYEPRKRLVGGSFGWASHRFPIKGGISPREALCSDASKSNVLLREVDFAGEPTLMFRGIPIRLNHEVLPK